MFETIAIAQQIIEERFTAQDVDLLMNALVPSVRFRVDADGDGRVGGTRMGGTPDMPAIRAWPARPAPENAREIAERGGPDGLEDRLRHLEADMPYAFIAQIDLEEADALGIAGDLLPKEGRLLFFYDLVTGPYDTDWQSGQVIWDSAPRDLLVTQEIPAELRDAEQAYRAALAVEMAAYPDLLEETLSGGSPYGGPRRAMELTANYALPAAYTVAFSLNAELKTRYEAEPELFAQPYDDLFYAYWNGGPGLRNQLLGVPVPEQDDPRFDAARADLDSRQAREEGLSEEALTEQIETRAGEWRLLLQVDLSDFMQVPQDGTIYFLINENDLGMRDFDNVIAVYQQT
ncbi:DUF1963 domain-containing protein [Mesorhizobium sp. CAU 1732]|uniref:DUF1963 domain-containing protein n=1 Tax=Mesorhizobium sp. CAU 1732 TaxID=3140358 RepID=UPI0032600086